MDYTMENRAESADLNIMPQDDCVEAVDVDMDQASEDQHDQQEYSSIKESQYSMDKSTMLLEECRNEIDRLAQENPAELSNVVSLAEKQLRACTLEWKQVQKTIDLTKDQQLLVEKARRAGEEKLALAQTNEEEARIAAETVARMIEDTNKLLGETNDDTAKILHKAGNVLQETADKAAESYREKQEQRKEVEARLLRLNATEKAVLYSMAKAERTAGEKMLVKVLAERRKDVYEAEYETVRMESRYKALTDRHGELTGLFNKLQSDLEQALKNLSDCNEAEQAYKEQSLLEIADSEAQMQAKIAAMEVEIEQAQQRLEESCAAVETAQANYNQCDEESKLALQQAQDVAQKASAAMEEAMAEQSSVLESLKVQIEDLHQQLEAHKESFEATEKLQKERFFEVERLRELKQQCYDKLQQAEDDEKAASAAAETAIRLAENAVKIRETISSENSGLLLQAQQVLMEAAESAQQLKDEKNIFKQSVQIEYDDIFAQVESAEKMAEEAGLQMELEQIDCEQLKQQLKDAEDDLEQKTVSYHDKYKELSMQAETEQKDANNAATDKQNAAQNAYQVLQDALQIKVEAEAKLPQIKEAIVQAEQDGAAYVEQVRQNVNAELARLADARVQADAQIADLNNQLDAQQEELKNISESIDQMSDQLRESKSRVDEIIAIGVLDIISAEETVGDYRYKEEAARRAAEKVSSYLISMDDASISAASRDVKEAEAVIANAEQEDEAPIIADEPVAEEDAPIIADEPVAEEDAPIIADEPVAEDEAPIIADEPVVEDEAPIIADEPVAEEDAPIIADEPVVEDEAPIIADEEGMTDAEILGFIDVSGLTEEELEYTQRLEMLGNDMMAKAMQKQVEPEHQVKSDNNYVNWMENLAQSLNEKGEQRSGGKLVEPEIKSLFNDDVDDGMIVKDAVLQVNEVVPNNQEEDELRRSILTNVESSTEKPKKRRFPFF